MQAMLFMLSFFCYCYCYCNCYCNCNKVGRGAHKQHCHLVILSLRNVLRAILQSMLLFLKRRHYKHGLLVVGVVMVAVVMVAGFKRVGKQVLLIGV